jgi:hypothetical protein
LVFEVVLLAIASVVEVVGKYANRFVAVAEVEGYV